MFGFENLDVYQRSLEFVVHASKLIEVFPKGQSSLADQLKRASMSIVLNIAESSGRMRDGDANQHIAIARGSAMECAAILDIGKVLILAEESQINKARELLVRIVQMLSKMYR